MIIKARNRGLHCTTCVDVVTALSKAGGWRTWPNRSGEGHEWQVPTSAPPQCVQASAAAPNPTIASSWVVS